MCCCNESFPSLNLLHWCHGCSGVTLRSRFAHLSSHSCPTPPLPSPTSTPGPVTLKEQVIPACSPLLSAHPFFPFFPCPGPSEMLSMAVPTSYFCGRTWHTGRAGLGCTGCPLLCSSGAMEHCQQSTMPPTLDAWTSPNWLPTTPGRYRPPLTT